MVKSRRDWGGERTWENKFKMFSVLKTYQCKAGGGVGGGGGRACGGDLIVFVGPAWGRAFH